MFTFVSLLAVAWLIPSHFVPWKAFQSDWLAAVALAVCVAGAIAMAGRSQHVPRLALAVAAIAAVPVLQWMGSLIYFAGDAWLAALYLLGFAIAIHAGFTVQRCDGRAIEPLAWAFVLVAAVSSFIAMCQWLRVSEYEAFMLGLGATDRPYANFAQPNQLATFLMLGLVCALMLHQWRRLTGFILGVLAVLLCVGVALSQSRAAWLEMAGLLIWLLLMRDRAGLRIGRGAVLALGAMFLVFVLALPWVGELLYLSSRGTEQQMQPGTRPIHWATVLGAIREQPWLGYGWNQLSVAIAHAARDFPASHEMVEHSHNLLLDLLAWNGVPLGLAIIGGGAWWLWRRASACRDATQALILAAIAMPLLHSMVEFPLEYAYLLLPVGFMVGVLEASQERRSVRVPRAAVAAVAALAAAVVAWIGVEYIKVEENTRLLRFESARIGASRVESSAPDVLLLTQQREFLRFARTEAKRDMPDEQIDWMRKVAERYGYAPVLFRYALATGLNGRPDAAAEALVRLCKTHRPPLCEEAQVNWASLIAGPYPELKSIAVPASD